MPVAIVGFYFLCITESLSINIGDIILLIGAIVFAIHILLIDHFVQKADGVRLSCAQFFACSAFATIGMFIFEEPKIEMMKMAWLPIAYSGILSCGVATTIQVIGQSKMNPSVASLILGLESVMGVLAGWVLLGESMNGREI